MPKKLWLAQNKIFSLSLDRESPNTLYRPALDLYNAYLNYGYAILYNKVEQAILRAGLHAHIGWWHSARHQRKTFVYDFIEPYRIWVDRVVFKLFSRKLAQVSHARVLPEGQYWLQKEGTQLVAQAFLEYYKTQKLELDGKMFTCETYLAEKTKKLAAELLLAFRTAGGRHALVPKGAYDGAYGK
jgi:CRISP-associated protein Cas1